MILNVLNILAAEATEAAHVATEAHAAEEPHGIAALGLDPMAIVAQAATFLLLFFIIKKFALQKIVNTLEARRKTIDDGVRLGLKMAEEKEILDKKVEEVLQQARVEADKIIAAGEQEAGSVIKDAEVQAARKVDDMLAEARVRIDKDIASARKGLEAELVDLVAAATEKIIGEKLDANKDAKLIEKLLSGVKE